MGMCGPRMQSAQRADVDDAAPGRFQVRIRRLGRQERSAGIGGKHRIPLLHRDAFQSGRFVAPGIVHQDVDAAELIGDGVDGGADLCGIAQVGPEGAGQHAALRQFGDRLPAPPLRIPDT